jgi:tRNA dimethylallyltransferase
MSFPVESSPLPVVVLTGPTGSGKTQWAMRLAERIPVEIVSVDSAQVFVGLDIGSAKPDAAARARVPHHLLDLRDPGEAYSAGDFVRDAREAIAGIHARGRLPLLVGGTMMYLRALLRGIASLPPAAPAIRARLESDARERGWPALHAGLAAVDPLAAARIHPHDAQRIQRALEVHELSGRPISAWHAAASPAAEHYLWQRFALLPADRSVHRQHLAQRFERMLADGFADEVRGLYARGDLDADKPAIRSVGYRQLWSWCRGEYSLAEAAERAVVATCQLAKRQMTWLRSDPGLQHVDVGENRSWPQFVENVSRHAQRR